jgi:hypothetical protein
VKAAAAAGQPSDQAPSPAELDRLVFGDVLATVRPLRGHALETTWRQRTWEALRALQAYARAKARQRAGRDAVSRRAGGSGQRAAGTVTATTGRFSGLSAPVGATVQEQSGLEPVRAPSHIARTGRPPLPCHKPTVRQGHGITAHRRDLRELRPAHGVVRSPPCGHQLKNVAFDRRADGPQRRHDRHIKQLHSHER